jgi:hypothetical protein
MPRVDGKAPHELVAGEYGKWSEDGCWYAVPPGTDLVANLAAHSIVEHADGTITVTPSILVGDGRASWHGYLSNGVFEEC